ncbi:MAG: hypothetical protein BWX48_00059 [Verrucomicrobia bacterium ADurb.Bin006]|nr:MAG: hypothetical protein BWX48_00059 [Verrucomicrobia bacterium ADurb.Bin006]
MGAQRPDIEQADVRDVLRCVQVEQDFVNELAAESSVTDGQVFEFHEPLQVNAHLRQAPAAEVAQLPAAKSGDGSLLLPLGLHQVSDEAEQAARLRRQLIERTAEHFRREFVRQRDVIERHLDELHDATVDQVLAVRPLVLVKQRDGVHEREIFFVVAPVACARRGEGERGRERIDHGQRRQEPLRVAEFREQVFALLVREQARERAPLALHAMNALGLRRALVHRQRQTAVLQLLVQVNRGRRQEDHHRAFDVIFLRHHFAGRGVFAGAGDGEFAFALQKFQRVAGALRAGFLDHGEDFVFEVRLAQVVERLARHRGVFDALLLREERQHRVHERRLARRAGALDDDGQRPFQLARHARQIRNERVGFLADDARLMERLAQAGNQVRLAQPLQRRFAFLRRERHRRRDVLRWLRQFRLRLLDREQQTAHVALEQVGQQSGFLGGAFDEAAALRVAAQIHLVEVKAFTGAQSQRNFQRVRAEGFLQARNAILAAFDVHEPCIAALFQRRRRGRCWLRLFFFSRRLR